MTHVDSTWIVIAGSVSFFLCILLVPLARRVAIRYDITDGPEERKRHKTPTPLLGGVAIALAIVGGMVVGGRYGEAWELLSAGLLVACVGLLDDARTATPLTRLAVEVVAASIALAAGARLRLFGDQLDTVLTIVWLVVLTNAYNLLDNMDACASIILGISAAALLAAAVFGGQMFLAVLAVAIASAAAAFLFSNWHPARIFLGDSGSLFLGFLVSATALTIRYKASHPGSVIAVALIAAPALFDTTLVVISRLRAHRPIYIGSTDHTSHRLSRLGVSDRTVAILLAIITAMSGALGVSVGRGLINPWTALGPCLGVGLVALVSLLRVSVYPESEPVALDRSREDGSLVTTRETRVGSR